MTITASPLCWPAGWQRTEAHRRTRAKFSAEKVTSHKWSDGNTSTWKGRRELTIAEATERVRRQLGAMRVRDDDLVISTNLTLRLDGMPKSGQREPSDPGAAVYWQTAGGQRCMAIDQYDRVADNLAAIAATLDAMRAIERHGGAQILERAFTGFTALPAPVAGSEPWYSVLGVEPTTSAIEVEWAYRSARGRCHPDRGGDAEAFARVQRAWDQYREQQA